MHHNEISIGEALQGFLNKSRLKPKLDETRIQDCWEEVMGKTIAHYTEKLQLIDHKLIITTSVAPLKHELSYSKSKIIQLVNEALKEEIVKEVIIK